MQASKRQAGFAALSIVVLLMTACGGGGGGSTTAGTSTVLSAYVANSGDGTISQYTINPTTGALTPKSPATICTESPCNTADIPESIVVDPASKYVYVGNSGGTVISQFTIGAGGVLVPMNPPTVPAGNSGYGSYSVAIDKSGKYLYSANANGREVAQFSIGTGGLLTLMSAVILTTTGTPGPVAISVDPSGTYVYVVNEGDNSISQFSINLGGGLTAMATASVAAGGTNPISITIDPTGKNAYVANITSGTISQFSITQSGSLSGSLILGPTVGGSGTLLSLPTSIAIDHSGMYAYVSNGSGVYQYSIKESLIKS